MPAITLDNELRAKLNSLNEVMPVQDEAGRTLGECASEEEYQRLQYAMAKASCPFTEEELLRRKQEAAGSSLKEFRQRMGRK